MKGFSMNKVLGTIKKRPTFGGGAAGGEATTDPANETPEDVAARCVKQFCQSVGSSSGDDVIYLPPIVEAAVASPAAAAECARLIRKFLQRDYWTKPAMQYNAIMLFRILADNPGPGFTRYIDKKFVETTKELLRSGRDASVRQILMEALDTFETSKSQDESLAPIVEMWKKEKEKAYKAYGAQGMPATPFPHTMSAPPFNASHGQSQGHYPRSHHSKRLPDPIELANRLEEARTSAKLLEQVVACTPSSEVLSNDLIKEFADRCTSASRSIQGYMAAEDPAPDNDTMENLIDTNEQLQQALNHHRRAVLQAKKQFGGAPGEDRSGNSSRASLSGQHNHPPQQSSPPPQAGHARAAPPVPARKPVSGPSTSTSNNYNDNNRSDDNYSNGKGKANLVDTSLYDNDDHYTPAVAGPSRSTTGTPRRHHEVSDNDVSDDDDDDDNQDPFRDPAPATKTKTSRPPHAGDGDGPPYLSLEPFHPGFGGSGGSGSGSGVGGGGSSSSPAAATAAAAAAAANDDDREGEGRGSRYPGAIGTGTGKVEGNIYRY